MISDIPAGDGKIVNLFYSVRVAKTGRNYLKEEFTPLLPTGIGERF